MASQAPEPQMVALLCLSSDLRLDVIPPHSLVLQIRVTKPADDHSGVLKRLSWMISTAPTALGRTGIQTEFYLWCLSSKWSVNLFVRLFSFHQEKDFLDEMSGKSKMEFCFGLAFCIQSLSPICVPSATFLAALRWHVLNCARKHPAFQ